MRNAIGLSVILLAMTAGATAASAQSATPDEAIKPNGAVEQKLALTAGQKHAIYNIVIRQRGNPHGGPIAVAVGAPVPPSVELGDLPDQAAAGDPAAALLKYAVVDSDVVVVDPVMMRVVDVIHGATHP
jgi:hypothetical protein